VEAGHYLVPAAAQAFRQLQEDAREAGFGLAIASSYRSFDRQLAIFNAKASGERPVHDDDGQPVALGSLPVAHRLAAILRYSALPGASRHHWGTDLDVYDALAVEPGYRVMLTPQEVTPPGPFAALHAWLDERMAGRRSHGFYRPYAVDRGGVAPERWHLSYAPVARHCEGRVTAALLRACWGEQLQLREQMEAQLGELLARYVTVPDDWCPLDS